MQIYLPIAEVSVNAYMLFGLGGIVGVLSGMFGVGGGFLITPLLFFVGIPPAVAVATGANQVVASSVSGVLAQIRRRNVDFRMGIGASGRRASGLGGRDLDLQHPVAAWSDRPGGATVLCRLSRADRALDAARKPAGAGPAEKPRRHGSSAISICGCTTCH